MQLMFLLAQANATTTNSNSSGAGGLITYLMMAIGLYLAGQKLKDSTPWLAFIPLVNIYQMVKLSGRETVLWTILCIIPCVHFFTWGIVMGDVAEKLGKPKILGYLCGVPCIGPFCFLAIGL